MLNCREVTRLCSEERERKLTIREKLSLKMHLMMCKGCANFRQQMRFLGATAARYRKGSIDSGAQDED